MSDPVFHITDEMIDAGMKVVRRAGGIQDEAILVGAFMAMLDQREGGKVLFGDPDGGPVFRFNMGDVS